MLSLKKIPYHLMLPASILNVLSEVGLQGDNSRTDKKQAPLLLGAVSESANAQVTSSAEVNVHYHHILAKGSKSVAIECF